MVMVRYVGNADPQNGNELISLPDRPKIAKGGAGRATKQEIVNLRRAGLLIEIVRDVAEPLGHSHGAVTHEHTLDFDGESVTDLEDLVDDHNLDVEGTGTQGNILKGDLIEALKSIH